MWFFVQEMKESKRGGTLMTQMGLNYLNYVESNRTNLANEGIKRGTLSETIRHNVVSEGQTTRSIDEQVRHNKVGEDISYGNLKEAVRHNKVGENISQGQLSELTRHNKVGEGISQGQLDAQIWKNKKDVELRQVDQFLTKAGQKIESQKLTELNRSNVQREQNDRYATSMKYMPEYSATNTSGNVLAKDGSGGFTTMDRDVANFERKVDKLGSVGQGILNVITPFKVPSSKATGKVGLTK